MGPADGSCVPSRHGEADALPQPSSLPRLPTALADSAADVLQQITEGGAKNTAGLHGKGCEVVPPGDVLIPATLVVLSSTSGCSGGNSTVIDMGTAEGVDAGSIPHQHPTLSVGEDCDAVWAASVSTVQASGFKDGHHTGGSQGPVHNVIEGSVTWQASRISTAGQTVMAEGVGQGSTVAAMGLLDAKAQPQGDIYPHGVVREEEAEALDGDGRQPGPAVRCCGSEEPGAIDLVSAGKEIIKSVLGGGTIEGPLLEAELYAEVRALGVFENRQRRVQAGQSVAVRTVVDGTDQVPGSL